MIIFIGSTCQIQNANSTNLQDRFPISIGRGMQNIEQHMLNSKNM